MDDLITTAEAARLAGVGVSSIKRWADQGLIQVIRTPGGHRRVIRSNLLRFLQDAAGSGAADSRLADADEASPSALGSAWADEFLSGDVFEIQAALLRARSRLGSWFPAADEACLGLSEIGLRWKRGKTTILQEHVASERLSRALATIAHTMSSAPDNPACLLACADTEPHTLALSFLQVCLLENDWRPVWVGAATPTATLCEAIATGETAMLALSASAASSNPDALAQVVAEAEVCCEAAETHLVLGGSGAWPNKPTFGHRFHSFTAFGSFLRSLA